MNKDKLEINWQANIADIGTRINEALFAFNEGDNDSVRDHLLEIHTEIYPNAHQIIPQNIATFDDDQNISPVENVTLTEVGSFLESAVPLAPDFFKSCEVPKEDNQKQHLHMIDEMVSHGLAEILFQEF